MIGFEQDVYWMQQALVEAERSAELGEVPVGAVLVNHAAQVLISASHNAPIQSSDPTAHAEIRALRLAGERLQNYRFPQTTLYVTLEPCCMCWGAMVHARIDRLVFGAFEPKAGCVGSACKAQEWPFFNHRILVQGGILSERAQHLLQCFFESRRKEKKVHAEISSED